MQLYCSFLGQRLHTRIGLEFYFFSCIKKVMGFYFHFQPPFLTRQSKGLSHIIVRYCSKHVSSFSFFLFSRFVVYSIHFYLNKENLAVGFHKFSSSTQFFASRRSFVGYNCEWICAKHMGCRRSWIWWIFQQ